MICCQPFLIIAKNYSEELKGYVIEWGRNQSWLLVLLYEDQ